MGCPLEEAIKFKEAYAKGFPGIAEFKKKGSSAVRKNGYIVLCKETGHKTYWWDFNKWLEKEKSHNSEFWDMYKPIKANYLKQKELNPNTPKPAIMEEVSTQFKIAAKWDRKALNSVTQGLGAVILKDSQIAVFNWIMENNLFNKVKLLNLTHDEANWEYPKEVGQFPVILKTMMEEAAAKYCKSLPIPAEAEVGECWIH